MRLKVAALALVLAICASQAAAMPAIAAPVIISFFGITGTVGIALVNIGVGLAFSALSSALARPVNVNGGPRGIQLRSLTAGERTPQSFILGRYVTQGHLLAPEMSHGVDGDTRYLTRVIDLSDVRVDALESIILDGIACELATGTPANLEMTDGDGLTPAIHPDYGPTVNKGDFIGTAWCKFYDGTQTTCDPILRIKYAGYKERPWRDDMIGRGVSYAIMTFLQRMSPVVWQGRPEVRFVVRGIRLYDPRKDSTAGGTGSHRFGQPATYEWTENPVVMIYNIMRGIAIEGGDTYGGGWEAADLPYAVWAAAMNACDVTVGSRKRYTAGYEVRIGALGDSPSDVIDELKRACSAEISDVGGTAYIRVGAPAMPVKFITDDDIIITMPQDLDPFPGAEESYNVVSVSFLSPSRLWLPAEPPAVKDAAAIAADGQELPVQLELPAVTNWKQAQHLQRAWLKDAQRYRRHTITLPPEAIMLNPLDTIHWTSDHNGYAGKIFEIGQIGIDPMTLCATLALREVDPTDYDWRTSDEIEDDAPEVEVLPPSVWRRAGRATVTISAELRIVDEQVSGVLVIQCATAAPYFRQYEVSYRPNGTNSWRHVATSNESVVEVIGIQDGLYDVRARVINLYGAVGEWTEVIGFAAAPYKPPPADVQDFAGNVVGSSLHLSWEPVPDLDLSYYVIRYSKKKTGASYQNAVTLVKKVGRPATTKTVPAREGTYFIKAVDKVGNASLNAAKIVVDTNIADLNSLNQFVTQVEHPAFAGATNNALVTTDEAGPYVTLASTALWDDIPGNIDDWPGLIDGGQGTVAPSGTYEFASYIDLSERYTSRVSVDLDVFFVDHADSMDAWTFNIDQMPGLWDGDPAAYDTASVRAQIATTNDDPAGSPLWSEWQDFVVGDVTARAMKFRAVLESTSLNNAPAIRELSVLVDMPDRQAQGSGISFTGTTTVTFAQAFKNVPVVVITASVLATGDSATVTNVTQAGFTVQVRNSAGNQSTSSSTINYVANGYGRRTT